MVKEKFYPLLLQWMRSSEIDDSMCWKNAAERQMCFVRDVLCTDLLKVPVFVVSTHTSKSILLPVYRFRLQNGIIVTARENFYGWVVSIKSPFVVNLPEDLVHGDGENGDVTHSYCEGFKEDWVYPYGVKDVRLSTFRVESNYMLWALMRELNTYPEIKKDTNYNYDYGQPIIITETIVKHFMENIGEDMNLSDIFVNTYYNYAYNYDFCKENNLDCYFHASSRDLAPEEERKEKIADFAKRICMTDDNKKAFDVEIHCLGAGEIDENGIEFDILSGNKNNSPNN